MKKIYVDKGINIFENTEAENRLKENSDAKYLKNNSIMSVDINRWKDAQEYEKKTWMVSNRHISDDRNYEHFNRFDSYNEIIKLQETKPLKKIIELGCGPFTNLRTLIRILPNLEEIHLLDPLLNDYLNHPNCFYKDKKINNFDIITHSIPIEKLDTNDKYDLVIMNNVLEHCYDINIIFNTIKNILNNNGVLIFSDIYFINDEANKLVENVFDAGHPLKLSYENMVDFLKNFTILYEKDFHGLYGQTWRHDKYFIGLKK